MCAPNSPKYATISVRAELLQRVWRHGAANQRIRFCRSLQASDLRGPVEEGRRWRRRDYRPAIHANERDKLPYARSRHRRSAMVGQAERRRTLKERRRVSRGGEKERWREMGKQRGTDGLYTWRKRRDGRRAAPCPNGARQTRSDGRLAGSRNRPPFRRPLLYKV